MKRQPGARTLGQAPTSGGVAELGAGGGGCTCGLSPTTHPAFWTLTLATGHTRGTAHPSGQGFTSHCTEYTCPTARRTDTQMWLSWGQESRGPPLGPRAPLLGGARPVRPPSQHPSPTRPQRQRQEETRFPCPRQVWALGTVTGLFIGERRLLGDYSQPDLMGPTGSPPCVHRKKYNKYNGPPNVYQGSSLVAEQPWLWAARCCAGGSAGVRCLLPAGRVAPSQHASQPCPAPAALCLPLLRERREHAEVREVLDVIVAGPLGRVSGHGQHVLQEAEKKATGESAHPPGPPHAPGAPPATHPHAHRPGASPGTGSWSLRASPGKLHPSR